MNKAEAIKIKLEKPLEVGDHVNLCIPFSESVMVGGTKKSPIFDDVIKYKNGDGKVLDIKVHPVHGVIAKIESQTSAPYNAVIGSKLAYLESGWYHNSWAKQSILDCGPNPFKPSPRIDFLQLDITGILYYCAATRTEDYSIQYSVVKSTTKDDMEIHNKTYGGVNFDPYVTDKEGNKKYYQRGLVWNMEQKQLLLDSIYNGIEIGKFVFRERSWDTLCKEMIEDGHAFSYECVDGKQRLNAILDFLQNKFKDSHGNYFNDLSGRAQRRILGYNKLAFGKLDESSTDADVINAFLYVNFTGIPMSKEHIEHVKSIKL